MYRAVDLSSRSLWGEYMSGESLSKIWTVHVHTRQKHKCTDICCHAKFILNLKVTIHYEWKCTIFFSSFWNRCVQECLICPGTCPSLTEPCAWACFLSGWVWWTPGCTTWLPFYSLKMTYIYTCALCTLMGWGTDLPHTLVPRTGQEQSKRVQQELNPNLLVLMKGWGWQVHKSRAGQSYFKK